MKKILIGSTICLIAALLAAGLYYPDAPLMWIASSTTTFAVLRGLMLAALITLLVTQPPRNVYLRGFMMVFGVALGITAVNTMLAYEIGFLDAIVLMEVAIICVIEGLEAELYEGNSIIDKVKAVMKTSITKGVEAIKIKQPIVTGRISSLLTK